MQSVASTAVCICLSVSVSVSACVCDCNVYFAIDMLYNKNACMRACGRAREKDYVSANEEFGQVFFGCVGRQFLRL